jgi:hypothetical protein
MITKENVARCAHKLGMTYMQFIKAMEAVNRVYENRLSAHDMNEIKKILGKYKVPIKGVRE